MAQIRITPEELREGASFLEQRLESINNEVNQLDQRINQVAGNWEGAAKSSFLDTYQSKMSPVLRQSLPECIQGICSQLRASADAIESADEGVASSIRG